MLWTSLNQQVKCNYFDEKFFITMRTSEATRNISFSVLSQAENSFNFCQTEQKCNWLFHIKKLIINSSWQSRQSENFVAIRNDCTQQWQKKTETESKWESCESELRNQRELKEMTYETFHFSMLVHCARSFIDGHSLIAFKCFFEIFRQDFLLQFT